jgi:hypothetical protein
MRSWDKVRRPSPPRRNRHPEAPEVPGPKDLSSRPVRLPAEGGSRMRSRDKARRPNPPRRNGHPEAPEVLGPKDVLSVFY